MPDSKPLVKKSSSANALTSFMPVMEAARRRQGTHSSRLLLYSLVGSFAVFLLWATFAQLEETVSGFGQIMTSQKVQQIQHLEGGIIRKIMVEEGDTVNAGDLLLNIDNEVAGSSYRDIVTKNQELTATIARLEAELNGGEAVYPQEIIKDAPEIIERHNLLLQARREKSKTEQSTLETKLELKKLEEQDISSRLENTTKGLAIATEQLAMAEKLMKTRSYSRMDYLSLAQQVNQLKGEQEALQHSMPRIQNGIREAEEKLHLHATEVRAKILQEKNAASADLATVKEALSASTDRATRAEVRSPIHGIIKSIHISTEGGVILPGQVIMEIVPIDENLIIEARIAPQHRAFLKLGQKARIRFTAYDFSIYGAADANLEYISADTIEGKQGEIYYKVGLRTKHNYLEHNGGRLPILTCMMASADIITGKRSVLQYILKPLNKARQTALREP